MVSPKVLKYLDSIVCEVNTKCIAGAIVECGVWKGGAVVAMMLTQKKYDMNREFYLYDTFDGMTSPTSIKDDPKALKLYSDITAGTYAREYDRWHNMNKWAYAPLNLVKANVAMTGYTDTKIHYVKGDVLTTLNNVKPACISIAHLDTDWYDSTAKELSVLYPLVSPGGYIVVDDYYAWKGSKVATDEFLAVNKEHLQKIDVNVSGPVLALKKL
jgi:hypothetical protein